MISLLLFALLFQSFNVTREGYDASGASANNTESILTPALVATHFGKLFSVPVDGAIYAQPLYLQGVLAGGAAHNVVYVATMNDSLYAFDADTYQTLWTANLRNGGSAVISQTNNVTDTFGILSTPVIDPSTNTIFAVAYTSEAGGKFYRLHALDVASGAEKFSGPVPITAPGFDPTIQMQRPALTLWNARVLVNFGSFGDQGSYHGWSMLYAAADGLAQTIAQNWTPSGTDGAVWMAGRAPVSSMDGNIVLATANGTYDGISNFGQSLLKIDPSTLTPIDWWTPTDFQTDDQNDWDLGSSGPVAIPGTSLLAIGGKQRQLVIVDSANMGHVSTPLQSFATGNHAVLSGMAFGNNRLYVWPGQASLMAWHFNGTNFDSNPLTSTVTAPSGTYYGGALAYSPGIVWSAMPDATNGFDGGAVAGILRALDATTLSEIWNSDMNAARDSPGLLPKFRQPLIANGKVYLGSTTNNNQGQHAALNIYGQIAQQAGTSAVFVSRDTATHGSWIGTYGVDGYSIASLSASVPAYATVNVAAPSGIYTWDPASYSSAAVQVPPSGSTRNASTWYANSAATKIDVNITDGQQHEFTIYVLDYDSKGRAEMIQAVDASTLNVLDTQTVSNFSTGAYLTWNISGHVTFVFTPTTGPNSVVSAMFFGGSGGTAGGSGTASYTITCPAWTGATSYTVTRADNALGPYAIVGTTSSTSFTDTTAQHSKSYFYVCNPQVTVP